jgi:signal transduction histidine kinase
LHCVNTDITQLLEDTYLNFKPLAEQKNLLFQLHIPEKRLLAFADVEAFNKILTNLFSNAVKYAASKVVVHLLPPENNDPTFTIEIKSDGYLIPFEMKEKIFEPFFRLKETEKKEGTGIGLALARSLVQLHKGVLDIKPTQDSMNVFYLTMPVNEAE